MCVYNKTTRSKLRAGGWRGAESAEGAAPRSPPASAVHGETAVSGFSSVSFFVLHQKRVTSPSPWPLSHFSTLPVYIKRGFAALPRSSRDGPAQTLRACSEEANSVVRGGTPAAAHHARPARRGRCIASPFLLITPPRCAAAWSTRSREADTQARRGTSRKSGPLVPGTRTCTCVDVRAHAEAGWWWWISLLPSAPYAMRARSAGRGRHARGRQERLAPSSCTPRRARPASTARYAQTGHGTRARCAPRPSPPIDSAWWATGRCIRVSRHEKPALPL